MLRRRWPVVVGSRPPRRMASSHPHKRLLPPKLFYPYLHATNHVGCLLRISGFRSAILVALPLSTIIPDFISKGRNASPRASTRAPRG